MPVQPSNSRPKARSKAADETVYRFDAVYDRYFDYVFRIVSRLAAGQIDVDDAVQDVFVVVHRRLPEFVGEDGLTTWLFQISHRVVRAQHRKQRVRQLFLTRFHREHVPTVVPGQLKTIENAQVCAAVSKAICHLSWKKRVALLLHCVEGWSCEEIAHKLDLAVGTVHSRIHHARRDIEQALRTKHGSEDAN